MSDPAGQTAGMKNELPPTTTAPQAVATNPGRHPAQLDFTLPVTGRRASRRPRPCSRERARWWFAQMRQVVDEGRTVEVAGVF